MTNIWPPDVAAWEGDEDKMMAEKTEKKYQWVIKASFKSSWKIEYRAARTFEGVVANLRSFTFSGIFAVVKDW